MTTLEIENLSRLYSGFLSWEILDTSEEILELIRKDKDIDPSSDPSSE